MKHLGIGVILMIWFTPECWMQDDELEWPSPTAEGRLLDFLKRKSAFYGTTARPVRNHRHNVTLEYGLRLIQIEVDEATNTLSTSVWIRQKWLDENMVWNRTQFDGVTRIMVPCGWLWVPRLSMVNTAEAEEKEREAKCLLKSTGSVWWLVHRIHRSACLFDVTNYPFDQHTCHLWFQSIQDISSNLDIYPYTKSPMDLDTYLSDFKDSDEWQILANKSIRVRTPKELGELLVFSRRTTLRFSLTLKRRPGFQAYLLTIPCVVLGAMSILVFALPAERPDRHSLATSLLGSFMFLLLILVNTAPPSAASLPKLGLYYAFNICMIVTSLCLSAVVVNVMRRGEKKLPMPNWIEKVFLDTLGQIFLCQQRRLRQKMNHVESEEMEITRYHLHDNTMRTRDMSRSVSMELNNQSDDRNSMELSNGQSEDRNKPANDMKAVLNTLGALRENLCSIDIAVHRILRHKVTLRGGVGFGGGANDLKLKWRQVALVLDRMFMTLYIITIIVSLIVLLPRPQE